MNTIAHHPAPRLVGFAVLLILLSAGEAFGAAHHCTGAATLAYIGPGAGLAAIGALLAVLAAVVVGLAGLILYPIQLLRNLLRRETSPKNPTDAARPS